MDPKVRTVWMSIAVIGVMGGLAWAAVPAYNMFCKVTGFGGVTQEADRGSDVVLDQTIKIRFDGSTETGLPWRFRPVERQMELKIGETGLAFFEASNLSDRPIAGSASYNVAPYSAGGYFTKIECFCFTEQVLAPGETVQMPVTFFVDPAILDDADASHVHTITLGYTFYETDLPEGYSSEPVEEGG